MPKLEEFIIEKEKKAYNEIIEIAKSQNFGIDFEQNDKLVRGLDYYNGLIFEIKMHNYDDIDVLGKA